MDFYGRKVIFGVRTYESEAGSGMALDVMMSVESLESRIIQEA